MFTEDRDDSVEPELGLGQGPCNAVRCKTFLGLSLTRSLASCNQRASQKTSHWHCIAMGGLLTRSFTWFAWCTGRVHTLRAPSPTFAIPLLHTYTNSGQTCTARCSLRQYLGRSSHIMSRLPLAPAPRARATPATFAQPAPGTTRRQQGGRPRSSEPPGGAGRGRMLWEGHQSRRRRPACRAR